MSGRTQATHKQSHKLSTSTVRHTTHQALDADAPRAFRQQCWSLIAARLRTWLLCLSGTAHEGIGAELITGLETLMGPNLFSSSNTSISQVSPSPE
jgi:hypothetical protein